MRRLQVNRVAGVSAVAGLAVLLAACAPVTKKEPQVQAPKPQCQTPAAGQGVVGNWLGTRKSPGIVGELKVWIQLGPDGKMAYSEQLQRRGKPPQSLSEEGCWRLEGQTLVLQTLRSNGAEVETDDPIYTNNYTVGAQSGRQLRLRAPDGDITLGRMPNDYRLPF